jgi:hypothetical protein
MSAEGEVRVDAPETGTAAAGSSRDSLAGAGWRCQEAGVSPPGRRSFSWINPVPLWHSRNQTLGSLFEDPTNRERRTKLRSNFRPAPKGTKRP